MQYKVSKQQKISHFFFESSIRKGYGQARSNLNDVKTQCVSCGHALCTKHRLHICRTCANSVQPRNVDRAGDPMRD